MKDTTKSLDGIRSRTGIDSRIGIKDVIRVESEQFRSLIIGRRRLIRADNLVPGKRGLVDTETGELFITNAGPFVQLNI